MFWEEKINNLSRQFDSSDFDVPFTDWPEIMKSIESKFILKQNSNNHFNNWVDNVKQKKIISVIDFPEREEYLKRLKSDQNIWIVVVAGESANNKHYVYHCNLNSLLQLISLMPGDFFIIDKKYNWFTHFHCNKSEKKIEIFKSGDHITPFEK